MLPRFTLALLAAGAFASETDEPVNKDNAIYVHPHFMVGTALSENLPLFIPITFETELEGGKSIAVQPTVIFGSIEDESSSGIALPKTNVTGIQVVASLRNYFKGDQCTGLYAAPAVMVEYIKVKRPASDWNDRSEATGMGIGALGFVGARGKLESFTTYLDIGVGYEWVKVDGDSFTNGLSFSEWILGLNWGFGIPF